jgi:hypothetical protein
VIDSPSSLSHRSFAATRGSLQAKQSQESPSGGRVPMRLSLVEESETLFLGASARHHFKATRDERHACAGLLEGEREIGPTDDE